MNAGRRNTEDFGRSIRFEVVRLGSWVRACERQPELARWKEPLTEMVATLTRAADLHDRLTGEDAPGFGASLEETRR